MPGKGPKSVQYKGGRGRKFLFWCPLQPNDDRLKIPRPLSISVPECPHSVARLRVVQLVHFKSRAIVFGFDATASTRAKAQDSLEGPPQLKSWGGSIKDPPKTPSDSPCKHETASGFSLGAVWFFHGRKSWKERAEDLDVRADTCQPFIVRLHTGATHFLTHTGQPREGLARLIGASHESSCCCRAGGHRVLRIGHRARPQSQRHFASDRH